MKAKFVGCCTMCAGRIGPGDSISKASVGWAHNSCVQSKTERLEKAAKREEQAKLPVQLDLFKNK